MPELKITEPSFPSPVRTIGFLLLVLFSCETGIMYLLPHLLHTENPLLENLVDAALLTALFTPVLYRFVFRPFQRAATLQKTLTDNVLANLVEGVVIFDDALSICSVNQAALSMFGYQAAELAGSRLDRILEKESLEKVLPEGRELQGVGAGEAGTALEADGRHKDGSRLTLELSLSQMQLGGRRVQLGIMRDVGARKREEAQMQQTLSLLHATLESTNDGIYVRDLAGRLVVSNRRFTQMWGIPEEVSATGDVLAMQQHVMGQLKDPEQFLELNRRQRLDPGREASDLVTFKDGRQFQRLTSPQVIDGRIVGQVICFRDITEQKNLEHQLRHAQKMEALGTLAGGVAHDFNNILTVIMGYCNLSAAELGQEHPSLRNLNQIMAASERAATLINSLLAYSRKQVSHPRPLELNGCVQQTEKFLARLLGAKVELVTRPAREKLTVLADPGQLEQVLVNLAANARDAMEGDGCLSIATSRIAMDAEFVRLHGYGKPGDYALITVSDTGGGMAESIRDKIFEPFFTTKEAGKGTGLGLSIVYGIVKQHDGHINVYSEPGHGTTFNIYLPLCGAQPDLAQPEPAPARGGSETILVAEDDPNVRALLRSVLSGQGYRVIEACHGEEALESFARHRDEIDLLVLDVVMPKKNGKETYLEIRSQKPGIRALFVSGYTADIIDRNGLVEEGLSLVHKPLLPSQLLAKVRGVLDRA